MKEDLLHYIWKYRLYKTSSLATTNGEVVEIVNPGTHNLDAGPDFSNARIRIGDLLLVGNVEIHTAQDDWYTHRHHLDKAYNTVILHVVFEGSNRATLSASGQAIPVLVLSNLIDTKLLGRYDLLKTSSSPIPCQALLPTLSEDFPMQTFQEQLLIERLQTKVGVVEAMLNAYTNDWNQVAFQMLAMYYGASVNKEPFALLAKSIPLAIIHKHSAEPLQLEALLFGQAGLLQAEGDDDYYKALRREYLYLKRLHSLSPIEAHSWKFFRTRPVNFPTIKIAQLAALLCKQPYLFSSILDSLTIASLRKLFEVEVNPYWQTHYQFDKPVKKAITSLGTMLTDVVLINAIAPVLFSYGRYKDDEDICNRVLELLDTLPAENNTITRMWADLQIKATSATQSQALIQLKSEYCDKKRCLDCRLGHRLLKDM